MIWNTSDLSALYLSRATAIFVFDCWQFGPRWIFGLEMKLMACADLVGGTTEQSCFFPDLIWWYKWYETLHNCLHHTSSVPQPFLFLIAANFTLAGFVGWKLSLWPVRTWLAVQPSKAVFLLTLYVSIDDMRYFLILASHLSRATVIFIVDGCQFGPNSIFWLKIELMACASLVGSTTEQSCLFPDL